MLNSTGYYIREASIADVNFFFDHLALSNNPLVDYKVFCEQFQQQIKSENHFLLVLLLPNDIPVGCIIAEKRKNLSDLFPFVEIIDFYIDPKYRKQQAADFLFSHFENLIASHDVYILKVSCNVSSTLNQNFYTQRKFKVSKKLYDKVI